MTKADRTAHNQWIEQYFDVTYPAQKMMWTNDQSLALHFGYWDENTKSDYEAQINTNRQLANRAGFKPGQQVLDAGCGIGGSSVWMAENYGVNVFGITVSQDQVNRATENAKKRKVDHLTQFAKQDFLDIKKPDASFDVVWALESASCALEKREFMAEIFRVLRPGGRLVLSDGFRRSRSYSAEDEAMLKKFLFDWAIPDLVTPDELVTLAQKAGFTDVVFDDVSKQAEPSMHRLYKIAQRSLPISRLLAKFKLISPISLQCAEGSYQQYIAFQRGLCMYGFLSATKPGA